MSALAAAVSALQVELLSVKSRVSEREIENESLRETIVNLTHENQLLKRRIYGNKTERSQTSELQMSLGDLFEAENRCRSSSIRPSLRRKSRRTAQRRRRSRRPNPRGQGEG